MGFSPTGFSLKRVKEMQILVKGIADPDGAGTRYTPVYQWCKTQTQMFKLIKQARKEGAVTVIINWKEGLNFTV